MALPTLDSVFASAADLPRRQMLARWLVEELGSGSIADYWTLPERYLWAKIAVAAGAPREEADYISLPKNYAWSDIYNAVAGLIPPSNVLVSGFDQYGDYDLNGIYSYFDIVNSKPRYKKTLIGEGLNQIAIYLFYSLDYDGSEGFGWFVYSDDLGVSFAVSPNENVEYPWNATGWEVYDYGSGSPVITESPAQTPNHTDWSENVALGHIAAAYRGDTGTAANLATYIDWPWRYKVASIIVSL